MPAMIRTLLVAFAFCLPATAAFADPCEAIPESGPLPSYLGLGAHFSGPVVHVIDGDSLCVAIGDGPAAWVEVRLADFHAPEIAAAGGAAAKAALSRLAMGREADCTANMRTYDRIAARCRIDGQAVGDLMRTAGVVEGGAGTSERRLAGPPRSGAARAQVPAGLSCAEMRARGGARRGDPGYRPEWDGDGDGIACEPYRKP